MSKNENIKLQRAVKRREALKRKDKNEDDSELSFQKVNDKAIRPADQVILDLNESFRTKYTVEQNYRAYKLFSIMDVDGGGSITLREVNRVLMGESTRFFTVRFDHPDVGITWGVDHENSVVITTIEHNSPASQVASLIIGLKLTSINDRPVLQNGKLSLHDAVLFLLQLHSDPVEFEFLEPTLIITPFTCYLDLRVESLVFSVVLPVGAVYDLEYFKHIIRSKLVEAHPSFKWMRVGVIQRRRQIYFKCDKFKFELLFATGPNNQRSCRFALGFSAEDYPSSHTHAGQPMAIDLKLGISPDEMEILMKELFEKFDKDGSGEFEFEEFRDFYVKFLDSEESLTLLKKFAQYRFRDIELEKWWYQKQEERQRRIARYEELKVKNAPIFKVQRQRFKDESDVGIDHVRRRVYKERPENMKMVRSKKRKHQELTKKKASPMLLSIDELNDTTNMIAQNQEDPANATVMHLHHHEKKRRKESLDDSLSINELENKRMLMKERLRGQAEKRKKKLSRLMGKTAQK